MIIDPVSFNGTSISSTDYEAAIPRASSLLQAEANPNYVKRAGANPLYAGKEFLPVTLNLEIIMLHDFMTLFESLNQLFDIHDETPRQFIIQDTEDSNKQYYTYATAKKVQGGHDGPMAVVTLVLDDPVWQSVTQNSQTFSTTASTSSTDVTINGNNESYPIFEITPSSVPSTDYPNCTYIQFLPTSTDPWQSRAIDITSTTDGTTFDTAALVAAGKMQADGDDLRVYVDGVEVNRWLSGINTTDTEIWIVADMPGAQNMTLKTALADSGDTVVALNYTTANLDAISALPNTGRLIVDSGLGTTDTEEITYTARTISGAVLRFTIDSRGVRNTTAIAHAANSSVRFLPYDIAIIYGNATASAPVTDDTEKPIFLLTGSNASWSYTNQYDVTGQRAGIWRPDVERVKNAALSRSYTFTSTNDGGDTDPSSAMGCAALSYLDGGIYQADSVRILWSNYFPDLVATVIANGTQTQTVAGRPAFVLQCSTDGVMWANLWLLTAQVSTDYSTWTAWSKASSDAVVPANTRYLRFNQQGTVAGAADNYAKVAVESVTVTFTNAPHVMIRAEVSNVQINCTIYNDTTGESFSLTTPVLNNTTVYVNTDPDFPTVKYQGIVKNGSLTTSTHRARWLKLNPGSNTISYENNLAVANDVSIVIKWRDRMAFL